MREVLKRCIHCRSKYQCLVSGHSSTNTHTDSRYCPSCLEVVREALAKVPKRFEYVWEPTDVVDLETLLKWEREQNRVSFIRRVTTPLFNLEDGTLSRQGIVKGMWKFQGRTFMYHYWPGKEEEASIREERERNLETGQTRPWVVG